MGDVGELDTKIPQLTLALEELDTGDGERHQDRAQDALTRPDEPAPKARTSALPDHLPRIVVEHASACVFRVGGARLDVGRRRC